MFATNHDFEHNVPVFVGALRKEFEASLRILKRQTMRDKLLDVREFARAEESKRGGVCVGVAERAVNIDFTESRRRKRKCDIARPHSDKHHLSPGHRSLWG